MSLLGMPLFLMSLATADPVVYLFGDQCHLSGAHWYICLRTGRVNVL